MYINFWYPMATSEELTDKPLQVRALGQDFVIFRGEDGESKCVSNTCTHRGGSLAHGKINGNCMIPVLLTVQYFISCENVDQWNCLEIVRG